MRLSPGKRMRRTLMASMMLVVFASHAIVPSGFMPAKGRPFLLEICSEGLPASLPAEDAATKRVPPPESHHHGGGSSRAAHCVFASTCLTGPVPHLPPISEFSCVRPPRAVALASIAVAVRVVHLPQPRAPPSRLS